MSDDVHSPDDVNPSSTTDEELDPGWPWSFLLLVAAGALYLIFRFVELGIEIFN